MKHFTNNTISNFIFAVLSGVLLALSFPHPAFNALAWIAFIPLFFAIRRSSFKIIPFLGLAFGMAFFLITLSWIQVFGFIAWIVLSIFLSVWIIVFTTGAWAVFKYYGGMGRFVLIPSLWAVCEFARSLGPLGFSWANVGSTVDNPLLLKVASYTGELGLGFVIILVNLILFHALSAANYKEKAKIAVAGTVVLLLYTLVWPAAGAIMYPQAEKAIPRKINVAIVQPNIPQDVKRDTSNNSLIKLRYLKMTREALKAKPDVIIWPESIFLTFISDEKDYLDQVNRIIAPTKTQLIFGGLTEDGRGGTYNNAIYVDQGQKYRYYQKIHLVPFGEYVPMRSFVERINNMTKLVQERTPGNTYSVFDFTKGGRHEGKFSTIICFESSDSALVGRMVKNGARALFVVTNDGWFDRTAALEQHFRVTRMRAAEYGIPVVQDANTGISGIVDGDGSVTAKSAPNKPEILYGSVTFSPRPSLFSHIGFLLPYLYLIAVLVGLAYKVLVPIPSGQSIK